MPRLALAVLLCLGSLALAQQEPFRLPRPKPARPAVADEQQAELARRLCTALDQGDAEAATAALAAGAQPNTGMGAGENDTRDRTPLIHAVLRKEPALVDLLLHHGARLDSGDAAGHTPLMYAALTGNGALAKHLLQRGARPDVTDQSERRAADYAGDHAEVRELLAAATRQHGELLQALAKDDLAAARQCLAAGASPNANDGARSLLLLAVQRGDRAAVTALLEAGCRADLLHVSGFAVVTPLGHAAEQGPLELLQQLLANGPPNRVALDGALALAAGSDQADRRDRVRLLLAAGANPAAGSLLQTPALPAAASRGDLPTMALLLEAGADQEAADHALIRAAGLADRARAREVARALLAAGADPTASFLSTTALGAALGHDDRELGAELLARATAATRNSAANELARSGRAEPLRWLCEQARGELDLDAADGLFDPPLVAAVQQGHLDCVKVLLAAGADPNLPPSLQHETPLVTAIRAGRREAVEILLQAGADPVRRFAAPLREPQSALDAARAADQPELRTLLETAAAKAGAPPLTELLAQANLQFTATERFLKLRFDNVATKRSQLVYVRKAAATYQSVAVHEVYSLCYDAKEPPPRELLLEVFQRRFAIGSLVLEQPGPDQGNWRIRFRLELPVGASPDLCRTLLDLAQATGDELERQCHPGQEDRL